MNYITLWQLFLIVYELFTIETTNVTILIEVNLINNYLNTKMAL